MIFPIRTVSRFRRIFASIQSCHRSVVFQATFTCSARRTLCELSLCLDYGVHRSFSKSSIQPYNGEIYRKDILNEYYKELMTNATRRTADEWSAFGSKFEQSYLKSRWPTVMLNYIIGITESVPGLFEVGISLIEYAALGGSRDTSFLLLATVAICVHQGGPNKHDTAFVAFKQLLSTIECFDLTSINILIGAISKTDQWKECLKLINMVTMSADVSACHLSPFLVASLQHNDIAVFDSTLHMMAGTGAVPTDDVYHLMLDLGQCEQLVQILKKFSWVPSRRVACRIASFFERLVIIIAVGL